MADYTNLQSYQQRQHNPRFRFDPIRLPSTPATQWRNHTVAARRIGIPTAHYPGQGLLLTNSKPAIDHSTDEVQDNHIHSRGFIPMFAVPPSIEVPPSGLQAF